MKSIQNIIINLLLFFYITSSFLSATHTNHQALEEHGDCKVCIIIKNLNSSNNPTLDIDILSYNYYNKLIFSKKDILLSKVVLKGFHSTAPPKLS